MSTADIGQLNLGLQGLTSSVSSYFASFGTGMGATIILIIVGLSYLNCRRGESAQPSSGPVVIQAPAAPAPAQAPVIISAPVPSAPSLPTPLEPTRVSRRKRRRRERSCCMGGGSDEDFSFRYQAERQELEMLRDRYNCGYGLGADHRLCGKPCGRMASEDSGAESPSHMELHDRLKSFLN